MSYDNINAIVADNDDGGDIDEVAAHIIKLILAEDQGTATELLLPVVREVIRAARRRKARQVRQTRNDAEPSPYDRQAAMRRLVQTTRWVPGKGLVSRDDQ